MSQKRLSQGRSDAGSIVRCNLDFALGLAIPAFVAGPKDLFLGPPPSNENYQHAVDMVNDEAFPKVLRELSNVVPFTDLLALALQMEQDSREEDT